MNENNTQIQPVKLSVKTMLKDEAFKQAIGQILPRHITPDRMARAAIAALTKTPKLSRCTPESFTSCMMTLSQLGLEPDGRRAYLIPYENTKAGTVECTLMLDYKGIVSLVMRTGIVSNIHADVVCENDIFEYDLGEIKKHSIDFRKPRGSVYAVYCIVTFKDGSKKAEAMSSIDIEAVRRKSPSGNSIPWKDHWNEMAKKTVFKRLSKWIPLEGAEPEKVDDYERVNAAIVIDDLQFERHAEIEETALPAVPKMDALTASIKGKNKPEEPTEKKE